MRHDSALEHINRGTPMTPGWVLILIGMMLDRLLLGWFG